MARSAASPSLQVQVQRSTTTLTLLLTYLLIVKLLKHILTTCSLTTSIYVVFCSHVYILLFLHFTAEHYITITTRYFFFLFHHHLSLPVCILASFLHYVN